MASAGTPSCISTCDVVSVFAGVRDAHGFERRTRFRGMRQPHTGCVPSTVQFCGFHGPQGHAPAKDDDSLSFFERVFHYKPATYEKKKEQRTKKQHPGNTKDDLQRFADASAE